jgi:hypothetical protein
MKGNAVRRYPLVMFSAWAAAIGTAAIWGQPAILGGQSPEQPALAADRASVAALLGADPGTYVMADGRLERADENADVQVLVQADARRGTNPRARVPLAITGEVHQDWTMHIRIVRADGPAARANPVEDAVSGPAGQVRAIREFMLEPGNYETVVALVRQVDGRGWIGTIVRHPMSVPDVWAGPIAAAPVVLGDSVAAARPEERDRPFVFGPTRLTPAIANRFKQGGDLHFALRVYNWKADESAKPDLTLEFVFHQRMGDRLRFFNKLKPQAINARTLGAIFDGTAGAVAAGMTVPLASFPPGEFELSVRIVDARTRTSVTQKVRFFVSA